LRAVLIQGKFGGFGDENGSSRGLSSPADLQWMRATRAVSDAVLVSYQTAVREKYDHISLSPEFREARQRLGLHGNPQLVVFTRTAAHAEHAREFADLVFNTAAKPLDECIRELNEMGLIRLSCEGGPKLIEALIEAGLVDQLALTTSRHEAHSPDSFAAISSFAQRKAEMACDEDGFTFALHGELPNWKDQLHGLAFDVLRNHDTERPFSTDYEKSPAPGYYVCRGCGNRLFDADTQFDARCGWPAFWRPSRNDGVRLLEDRSMFMKRIEVRCKACDGHLGHVFEGEGFGFPTDQRYCINAIALERRF
jgi:peptide-methionine (R)-S-oxide reductase